MTNASFKEKKKYSMRVNSTNSETPSSKFDFDFTDFAPQIFSNLRERFAIQPADYLVFFIFYFFIYFYFILFFIFIFYFNIFIFYLIFLLFLLLIYFYFYNCF